ncbi:hypothetical protein KSU1_B0233 [Candidatus Jettenia caeni]|uniref:Uncharacterized protein n=1 Tax=Candidatus Jettenia caeni TaxID=247490 RepID=I3IH95_9BACT|nr:hypothetical protein [Candidatus Jettenia sp. AMX1]NUN23293.1 hypothetical protein [Candidatus Jettenia caeni]WKZ16419.1 MAG: hypothetical protein QY317_03735 [Candidatus Jettenia caeni]GAB61090.1 hypothetical protein KSU1_B0233 [Candidatus Jettenia caeni]GIL19820.1 MAG: hypothetical protein BroJett041_09340 [Candidatus Jettenia caeni]GJQ46931.1 MAG: hypothetical protein JETCAE04_26850 [Candidatus Jettenia caeni]
MKRNQAWIIKMVREGYEIVDIGIDPTRSIRSHFYKMEKQIINQKHYPIIPYGSIIGA